MSRTSGMEFTGERYIPSVAGQIKYEHLHRYALAAEFAAGKAVLDVASGEGYGAALLARVAASVTGVDISAESVAHAARTYYHQNLEFLTGGCDALPLADAAVDVVTSFETIEHHDRHEEMMSEIKRVLKPGGVLVISSPNRLVYSDESNYQNPFHVRELYFDEFRRLLGQYFKHLYIYGQRLALGSFVYQLRDAGAQHYKSFSGDFEHLASSVASLPSPVYFIAVCSDVPLADAHAGNSIYIDAADDLLKPAAEAGGADEEQARSQREGQQLREAERQVAALGQQLQESEQRGHEKVILLQEKELQVGDLTRQLAALGEQLRANDQQLRQQSQLLSEAERARSESENLIRVGEEQVGRLSVQLEASNQKLRGAAEQLRLTELQVQLEIRRSRALEQLNREMSQQLLQKDALIRERDEQIRDRNAQMGEGGRYVQKILLELEGKERLLNEYARALEDFGRSGSYRLGRALTWPIRVAKRELGVAPHTGTPAGGAERPASHAGRGAGPPRPQGMESAESVADNGLGLMSRGPGGRHVGDTPQLQSGPPAVSPADPSYDHLRGVLFDEEWYLQQNPEVAAAGHDPLDHYLRRGAKEGRAPHPAFDPKFYLRTYPDSAVGCPDPLRHYLTEGWRKGYKPNPKFDPRFYLETYPDIAEAGVEPLTHFITSGLKEGRVGCPDDIRLEPFEADVEIPRQPVALDTPPDTDVKAIAFYLPQFHPIPENDAWWGKGFTEWTNVRRGEPQFTDHYQPHVPSTLGYYDLREPEVLEKQARLAREYGVYGFCFHYYWFAGKTLLDLPIRRMLETGRPDFPFCISWANENWTRRWDGRESEVLIAQRHSPEDDLAFIRNVENILLHRNYIRVDGKPLLLVYRPAVLPRASETTKRWRDYFRARGHGELYLATIRSFYGTTPPADYGFDATVQFPPHARVNPVTHLIRGRDESFEGAIHDYNQTKRFFVEELFNLDSDITLYPCVMPSWDNSARRRNKSSVWINASPESYYDWLSKVTRFLREHKAPEDRLVFINAWNEWAEGCHLEPDEQFGHAWLNATALALQAGSGGPLSPHPTEAAGTSGSRAAAEPPSAEVRVEEY